MHDYLNYLANETEAQIIYVTSSKRQRQCQSWDPDLGMRISGRTPLGCLTRTSQSPDSCCRGALSLTPLPQSPWDSDSDLGGRHSLRIYIGEAKNIERTKKGFKYPVSRGFFSGCCGVQLCHLKPQVSFPGPLLFYRLSFNISVKKSCMDGNKKMKSQSKVES